jgi:hypothetical protein
LLTSSIKYHPTAIHQLIEACKMERTLCNCPPFFLSYEGETHMLLGHDVCWV